MLVNVLFTNNKLFLKSSRSDHVVIQYCLVNNQNKLIDTEIFSYSDDIYRAYLLTALAKTVVPVAGIVSYLCYCLI